MVAILAGSPADKGSGLELHLHVRDKVSKGEPLITIYSESKSRIREAKKYFNKSNVIQY